MTSEGGGELHEPTAALSQETMDFHRALVSTQEELEAVDWYRQRAEACSNDELRAILLHNMREEMEHACMLIEWLRRNDDDFDTQARAYLFSDGPVLEVEGEAKQSLDAPDSPAKSAPTLGSLKGAE